MGAWCPKQNDSDAKNLPQARGFPKHNESYEESKGRVKGEQRGYE